jgi:hypothetical protein
VNELVVEDEFESQIGCGLAEKIMLLTHQRLEHLIYRKITDKED